MAKYGDEAFGVIENPSEVQPSKASNKVAQLAKGQGGG